MPYERLSRFYDLDWGHFALRYVPLVAQLIDELGLARVDVLDLACGTGALAMALGRQGHHVTGIDGSAEMVAVAREKRGRPDKVVFEHCDMRSIKFRSRYDIATCTFDAINYVVDPADLRRVFDSVHRALRPGGRFIFDSTTVHLFEAHHRGTFRRVLAGETFHQTCEYQSDLEVCTTTFAFEDGREEVHRQRAYGEGDLVPLLNACDLTVQHLWSDFDHTPAQADTHRLFVVARRET